jgi:hypothetical protein
MVNEMSTTISGYSLYHGAYQLKVAMYGDCCWTWTVHEIDGNQNTSNSSWYAIAGFILPIISLTPDVDKPWTVSLLGTVATVVEVFMFLAGCGVSIGQVEDATYGRPVGGTGTEFSMGIIESFGSLAFAYGGLVSHQTFMHLSTTKIRRNKRRR